MTERFVRGQIININDPVNGDPRQMVIIKDTQEDDSGPYTFAAFITEDDTLAGWPGTLVEEYVTGVSDNTWTTSQLRAALIDLYIEQGIKKDRANQLISENFPDLE